MRKKIIAGNWKMNMTPTETKELIAKLKSGCDVKDADVVFVVPSIDVTTAKASLEGSNIKLGTQGETIKGVGCLVTSVSIQIKISGTQVNTENFNPGTWVNYLNQHSGFSGSLFKWNKASWSGLAPNWDIVSSGKSLPKDKAGKIEAVKSYLAQGYYPIMCVKANCGHWVAVTGATDNDIIMADPGSSSTSVFTKYKVNNVTRVALFKKND